jgi:hypothetical protein
MIALRGARVRTTGRVEVTGTGANFFRDRPTQEVLA